jgi:hypothetical protein
MKEFIKDLLVSYFVMLITIMFVHVLHFVFPTVFTREFNLMFYVVMPVVVTFVLLMAKLIYLLKK